MWLKWRGCLLAVRVHCRAPSCSGLHSKLVLLSVHGLELHPIVKCDASRSQRDLIVSMLPSLWKVQKMHWFASYFSGYTPNPWTPKNLTEEQCSRIFIRFSSQPLQPICLTNKLVTFCLFSLNSMRSSIYYISDNLWDGCACHTDLLWTYHYRGWKN